MMAAPMSRTEKDLRVTVQLLDARRHMQDGYTKKVTPVREILRALAGKDTADDLVAAATKMVREVREKGGTWVHDGFIFAALADELEGVP